MNYTTKRILFDSAFKLNGILLYALSFLGDFKPLERVSDEYEIIVCCARMFRYLFGAFSVLKRGLIGEIKANTTKKDISKTTAPIILSPTSTSPYFVI